ncbi:filamentous hemagglutinin-like protein [uncultured Mediterranean phage uvMED]|nr:filamentous hemagglutinin-like protein [uncultured Mediterranean phage uvMED]
MPSDLQITNIKDLTGSNTGLSIASDGQITVNQNNPTLTIGSNATGFTGVKVLDQWRLTTAFSGVGHPISSNLERVDTGRQTKIGTGMTESSGIFTFPMTGIYFIHFNSVHGMPSGEVRYIGTSINEVISSTVTRHALSYSHINNAQASTTYQSHSVNTTFDCTDTSTDKVSFSTYELADVNVNTLGATDYSFTSMTFIRLGDT